MKRKIAFEEHMAVPETVAETKAFAGESGRWDEFTDEILDLDEKRLAYMDRAGHRARHPVAERAGGAVDSRCG